MGVTSSLFSLEIIKQYENSYDLAIYLGRTGYWPKLIHPCIYIQHGIYTDVPFSDTVVNKLKYLLMNLINYNKEYSVISKADRVVCVDTNFINVYRKRNPWKNTSHISYIPNFAHIPDVSSFSQKWHRFSRGDVITICFPRRFEYTRGVDLMLKAWEKICPAHENVEMIFMGWGERQKEVDEICRKFPRTKCIHADHTRALEILRTSHITVIPSLGSEGTSLSCIEAMARANMVIASNIGGLSNLILPDYNGLLINPVSEDLTTALSYALSNPADTKRMALNAYETAKVSFSENAWNKRIKTVISSLL